jgi:uncharacterized protein YlxP (DUF503 family)
MHVAVCRFTLLVPESHSLKEKRSVLRRLKERTRALGVVVAEVGGQDTWQRAELAFAVVADARDRAEQLADAVLRACADAVANDGAQLAAARREVTAYGDDWYASAAEVGRAWDAKVGDASAAADDASWVPAAWLADGAEGSGDGR